jgi:hypothetical protein
MMTKAGGSQVEGTSPPPLLWLVTNTKPATVAESGAFAAASLHTACGPVLTEHAEIIPLRCGTHTLDPDAVEYIDGLIVSYCTACRERFEIRWIPGGTGALMLRFVAEQILVHVDADTDPPSELVALLLDAHARVRADRELIEDSEALYQTLRHVLGR